MNDMADEFRPLTGVSGLLLLLCLGCGPDLRGATLVYSTFLGGPENDSAYAIAMDAQGNVYVAGDTSNTNSFPTLNALQPKSAGDLDLFIAKFNPAGGLVFSTYLGGSGVEFANAIALDRCRPGIG